GLDVVRGGILQPGAGGRARVPALHPAGGIPGLGGARRAALRPPRPDPGVAPGAGATPGEWRGGTATIGGPRRAPVPAPSVSHEQRDRKPRARATAPRAELRPGRPR